MTTLLFTLALFLGQRPAVEHITAVFDGASEGIYYFTADDGMDYGFDEVAEDVTTKFPLEDGPYVGKTFWVTFRIEVRTDADEMDYESYILTDLELLD